MSSTECIQLDGEFLKHVRFAGLDGSAVGSVIPGMVKAASVELASASIEFCSVKPQHVSIPVSQTHTGSALHPSKFHCFWLALQVCGWQLASATLGIGSFGEVVSGNTIATSVLLPLAKRPSVSLSAMATGGSRGERSGHPRAGGWVAKGNADVTSNIANLYKSGVVTRFFRPLLGHRGARRHRPSCRAVP